MTTLQTVNLGPMISSRRLFDIERQLVSVEHGLADLLEGNRCAIPDLPHGASGYRFLSLPEGEADGIRSRLPDMIVGRERHYSRRYIDMAPGFDAYMAGFSSKTRSTLRRKCRKFAELTGGRIDMRSYHGEAEIGRFFDLALPLSARTYQDRLLGAGLPADAAFRDSARQLASRGNVRAFLLFVQERPVAYLYLPVDGGEGRGVLRYDYLGYDPDFAAHSPGTVLQLEALDILMAEKSFAWFDFTSGDGAHKALFGTGELHCVDFVLLKSGWSNRCLLGMLDKADWLVERAGEAAHRVGLKAAIKRTLRRA